MGNAYPAYHFTDSDGKRITLRQSGPNDGPGTNVLELVEGGLSGNILIRLTQQNVIDIISTGLLNFANNGTLS